ncbi:MULTISPECIES: hypothetical protein [Enterobacteriaceae]|uniref:hypothetical protein n=1 Tax=Enterobacteriaceae TaxID=543 RepID=UPI002E2BE0B3|nr:hypothetical protein [Klebsiella pneumoniae]MED6004911.1 hypothetical protein [Klebsiella pneumoniae]MED6058275.1 hypothetical protein [Klebsiella pneumoniae]
MKKLLAALILMPSMASAGFCDVVYDLADKTIELRQQGELKSELKEVADDIASDGGDSVYMADIVGKLIDIAYMIEVYHDDRDEVNRVAFAHAAYDTCKKEFAK